MKPVGKLVRRKRYRHEMAKHGFRYDFTRNRLLLSYPYLPKEFSEYAASVQLSGSKLSPVCKIASIDFYRKGSGYRKAAPSQGFKSYVDGIVEKSVRASLPAFVVQNT